MTDALEPLTRTMKLTMVGVPLVAFGCVVAAACIKNKIDTRKAETHER